MKKSIYSLFSLIIATIVMLPLQSFAISNVLTAPAKNITDVSATFTGSGNPEGVTAFGYFRYASTQNPPIFCNDVYGSNMSSTNDVNLGNGSSDVTFTKNLTGLTPNTTYYYCSAISPGATKNTNVIRYGGIQTFTTKPCSTCAQTTIQTNNAKIIDDTNAYLNAFFNTNVKAVTWFEYREIIPGNDGETKNQTGDTQTFSPWLDTTKVSQNTGTSSHSSGQIKFLLTGIHTGHDYEFKAMIQNQDSNSVDYLKTTEGETSIFNTDTGFNTFNGSATDGTTNDTNSYSNSDSSSSGNLNLSIETLTLSNTSVTVNNSIYTTTLSWDSENILPGSCISSGGWTGNRPTPRGAQAGVIVTAVAPNFNIYRLSCTGISGKQIERMLKLDTKTGSGMDANGSTGNGNNNGNGISTGGGTNTGNGTSFGNDGSSGINFSGSGTIGGGIFGPTNNNSTPTKASPAPTIGSKAKPFSDAIVHSQEGIETVFARQIIDAPAFAKSYGYKTGDDLQFFAGELAHAFAQSFGYYTGGGREIRVNTPDVVAYELGLKDGKLAVYEYYKNTLTNIAVNSGNLKNAFGYEYYFSKKK
ncbi:hypothetical protein K8Q94_03580 [Candidatus Nomurabacteria bacterium]|nr:hypothetical protein [Candidatus Nomurabacteria bacterium]